MEKFIYRKLDNWVTIRPEDYVKFNIIENYLEAKLQEAYLCYSNKIMPVKLLLFYFDKDKDNNVDNIKLDFQENQASLKEELNNIKQHMFEKSLRFEDILQINNYKEADFSFEGKKCFVTISKSKTQSEIESGIIQFYFEYKERLFCITAAINLSSENLTLDEGLQKSNILREIIYFIKDFDIV